MAIVETLELAGGRRVLRLQSPVDGSPIGEFPCADPDEVAAAIRAARAAQPAWAALDVRQRAAIVLRARDLVVARQDEIVATVMRETGKSLQDTLSMEIFASLDFMSYYAKRAAKMLAPTKVGLHGMMAMIKKLTVTYRPMGVVGVITPWNAPFVLGINPTTQALLAGNAVILKGSEVTPSASLLVADIYRQAGLPEGLLQVLTGDGRTGAALVEGGVNKISFTGSVPTGRRIGEACGRQLIPCTLELGGTDAMIVCDDVDVNMAADGVLIGSYMNCGQYCCGTQRVLAPAGVYDDLVKSVADKAATLRQGAKLGGDEDVGAVIWDKQVTIIERHVHDAVAKGARLLVGGKRSQALGGLYFEPTVLVDCTSDMLGMREETFGPVVAIQKVKDEEEAIRLANAAECGLTGNVWSGDPNRAWRLAMRMEAGSVMINDMAVTYGLPEAPFGGVKASGVGRVNGTDGLRGYCQSVPVITNRFKMKTLPAAYPYGIQKVATLRKTIRFLWASGLGRWFQ